MLQRVFNILYREGLLPAMPDGIDGNVDIQYTGPLARAQKSDLALSTERWLQGIAAVAELFPEVQTYPDLEYIVREQVANLNLPPKYMRSSDSIAQQRKAREQAQRDAMAIQQVEGAGKAMEAVGKGAQSLGGPNEQ
jgi:hypothetical protein